MGDGESARMPSVSFFRVAHDVRFPRSARPPAQGPRRARPRHAYADPGPSHTPGAQGPRPARRSTDRHRQDRRFRPAVAAAADPGGAAGRCELGACTGPGPDPRTGRAGPRQRPRLRPAPAAAYRGGLRWGQHQPADDEAAQGSGYPRRHSRAAARPVSAERGEVRPAPGVGAGRSRSHARPRFRPRAGRTVRRAAAQAPDPAVFRDLLRRHPHAGP